MLEGCQFLCNYELINKRKSDVFNVTQNVTLVINTSTSCEICHDVFEVCKNL